MLIDKLVKVKITSQTRKHYYSLGYSNLKVYDIIEIPVEHLSKNSHHRINCQCDTCGNKRSTTYQDYLVKIKYDNIYYCRECMKEKRKRILKEKYGIENVFQLEKVKKDSNKTKLEKYGNVNYRNDDKREETILKNYGCINVFQNEKVKQKSKETNLEKFGFEYASQNSIIKEKSCQTNIKRYGFPYSHQNKEIFEKSFKSNFKINYWENGLLYQGNYEKDFLEHCVQLNVLDLISKPKSIRYFYNGRKSYYHPDFYLEKLNLIIEIKSDYWYKIHKERNILKEISVKEHGFNFLLILNKNYTEFDKFIFG